MPGCNESYEDEIADGKNAKSIKCKYCQSVILLPSTATFNSFEVISIYHFTKNLQKKKSFF